MKRPLVVKEPVGRGRLGSGKALPGVDPEFSKGGGGTNECRRYELSREVWGHAPPPEIFENLSL